MEKKTNSTYTALKSLDKIVQKDKKKDYGESENGHRNRSSSSMKRYSPKRKTNYRKHEEKKPKEIDYDIPDRSFGDLYCSACDAHMNSDHMWDAHIRGKRHLKQIKKSEPDHKYEAVNEDAIILPEIRNVKEPIVGLQHCCEIQRLQGKPTYQCFLCSASIATSELLIDHVIGLKHRMAYLKEHDPVNHNAIMKADLKKGMIEPVVEEYVQKLEDKEGSGKMPVKVEKPKPKEIWLPANQEKGPRKRPYDDLDHKKKNAERDSYDYGRNEAKYVDSDYRDAPERTRNYSREYPIDDDDKYDRYSESSRDNSVWKHDLFERNEASFSRRRSLTPPLNSGRSYGGRYADLKTRDSDSLWNKPEQSSQYVSDLRQVLEKKQMQDANAKLAQSASSPPSYFDSLRIIEDLPNMMFLELVLHKVQRMNPSDTELDMLRKIGDYMFALVMNKRMEKLPADLLNKYQEKVSSSTTSQGSVYKNPASDQNSVNSAAIQSLLDLFKNPRRESETSTVNQSFASQSIITQPVYSTTVTDAAFSTQSSSLFYNLWGSPSTSKESSSIPGLTLSSAQESSIENRFSYNQDPTQTRRSGWSPNYDRY